MKVIETMEINELKRAEGLRYRITANEVIGGGEFTATIQLRAPMVQTEEGPYLPGALALALLNVIEELRMTVLEEAEP